MEQLSDKHYHYWNFKSPIPSKGTVSYTHLDVYKRQGRGEDGQSGEHRPTQADAVSAHPNRQSGDHPGELHQREQKPRLHQREAPLLGERRHRRREFPDMQSEPDTGREDDDGRCRHPTGAAQRCTAPNRAAAAATARSR